MHSLAFFIFFCTFVNKVIIFQKNLQLKHLLYFIILSIIIRKWVQKPIATLTLGSWLKQRFTKVQAKNEA
jgi:hypothetical protein